MLIAGKSLKSLNEMAPVPTELHQPLHCHPRLNLPHPKSKIICKKEARVPFPQNGGCHPGRFWHVRIFDGGGVPLNSTPRARGAIFKSWIKSLQSQCLALQKWMPREDSNLDKRYQKPLSYH